MHRSMRAMVGAGVLAVAAVVLPLGGTALAATGGTAPATTEDSATTAATWRKRGPFTTYAACDRVRSQMVSLGYATQPCFHLTCGTAPNCVDGWYYRIWQ